MNVRVSSESPSAASSRSCGSCTLCCKLVAVDALGKGPAEWCVHCKPGVGCRIYETRPEECRTFDCVWLTDTRLGAEWKPDRAKFVLITARDGNGIEIRCDPGSPTAWRRPPYYAQVMAWAREAAASQGIVIAYVGKRGTLITPDAEFPLGEVEADDQIVRELSGTRVVAARVVKAGTAVA